MTSAPTQKIRVVLSTQILTVLGTMTRAVARDLMPIGAAALLFDNE